MAITENTPELTAEQVRALLRYEPETGLLFWRERPLEMCPSEAQWKRWNKRLAGKEAFTFLTTYDGNGYRRGRIFDRLYLAHRVIWLIQTGEWPKEQIDHRNKIRTDNRWENLACASNAENSKNKTLQSNNTSGRNGVSWNKCSRRWQAKIKVDGRQKHLGSFSTPEEAAAAREKANITYGFRSGHGT